jgi:hypothetical protein
MFGRRTTKAKAARKAAQGVGKAARSGVARKAARGVGRTAFKGGKAQARLVGQALSSREPVGSRLLKYGFFAIVGFVIGALVARSGEKEVSSSSTSGTGPHTPDPGSPAGQRGETWGTGTPLGTAGGSAAGGTTDIGTHPSEHQRPEDPNRTGPEREFSDPASGPLSGRRHRGHIGDVPEQQQEVEQRIRTRVGEDPRTPDLPRLNVEVNEGVADIRGEVHSEEEKQAVEEIARDTEGVTEVRNLLTVNPDAPRRRDRAAGGEPDRHS